MHAPTLRKRVEMSYYPGMHNRAPGFLASRYDDALVVPLGRHTRVGVASLVLLTKRSLGPCTTTTFFSQPGDLGCFASSCRGQGATSLSRMLTMARRRR